MSKLVVARSPARTALAEAISLVGKIREAITGREAARQSLPADLAERADEIADRLEALVPSPEESPNVDRRPRSDEFLTFRSYQHAPGFEAPRPVPPEVEDRIQALIDGAEIPEDDLDATAKEIAALREELGDILAREAQIERHNARVESDVAELRSRLDNAERDVKRAVDFVMRDEGGRDELIAAHARAVAIETLLRKAIDGAASPWIPPDPQPSHSYGVVVYAANRDAKPCLWGTAAERLRTDPDVRIPTVAEALRTLPDVAPPAVGATPSARNAA